VSIARLWSYAGQESIITAPIVAFLFTYSTLGLLVASLAALRGPTHGLIGGLILLCSPTFTYLGQIQYADTPLGYFYLAALVLFSFGDSAGKEAYGLTILAGIAAGFAAWTKNEGFLFLVALIGARTVSFLVYNAGKIKVEFVKEFFGLALGLLPAMLASLYFKFALAPQNDIIIGQSLHATIGRLLDPTRYLITARAILSSAFNIDNPLALPLVFAIIIGVDCYRCRTLNWISTFIVFILMFWGHFFIYIITPHDLKWQLSTSLDRIILQLWPGMIFATMLIIKDPIFIRS
jgi:hypothetical protein